MFWICVVVITTELFLAILSRIHFSKYKKKNSIIIWSLFLDLAESIYGLIKPYLPIKKWEHFTRRTKVVSQDKLQRMVADYVVSRISIVLLLIFVSCLGTLISIGVDSQKNEENILTRDDYGGVDNLQTIYLSVDDVTKNFRLELLPQRLDYEQFLQKSNRLCEELEKQILGENEGLGQICSDLKLPVTDKEGIFTLRWQSENAEILSSSGKVYLEALGQGKYPVCLSVFISYEDYEVEHSFDLVIERKLTREELLFETVKKKIVELEEQTRGDARVRLPKEIDGVNISLKEGSKPDAKFLLLGGVLALLVWPLSKMKERENISKRNTSLSMEYVNFINHLWILLGTGMTLQRGFRQLVLENQVNGLLKEELEYALHRIDVGVTETEVYEDLGRQLELPEYRRFLQQVSQNIRVGTKDLRGLMEQEVQLAQDLRRENAKKKGEVASTKMLFPMMLLLVIVMMIVIYPALAII